MEQKFKVNFAILAKIRPKPLTGGGQILTFWSNSTVEVNFGLSYRSGFSLWNNRSWAKFGFKMDEIIIK